MSDLKPATLKDLPAPPPSKTGWPWTEESQQLGRLEELSKAKEYPRITIVTPNYNYGHFLEETIRSVLLQGYPNLEYIVLDAGSSDNSLEIIQKYEPWISYWVSKKDNGQANAINSAMDIATGTWFNWLNSDDILLPNSLHTLIEVSELASDANWITGGRIYLDRFSKVVDVTNPWRTDSSIVGFGLVDFPQDSTFIKLDFLRQHNFRLNEQLNNIFDTILYWEICQLEKPLLTSAIFSAMRLHEAQKTFNKDSRKNTEHAQTLLPIIDRLPLRSRVVRRILQTRFHFIFRGIISTLLSYGLTPDCSQWQAVVFDCQKAEFTKIAAKNALLR